MPCVTAEDKVGRNLVLLKDKTIQFIGNGINTSHIKQERQR